MEKLVHTREISIRTSDLGDHYILVEGSLIDHRYQPGQIEASEESELVHHMVIRLKVKGVDRTSRGHNASSSEGRMPRGASLDLEFGGIENCSRLQYKGKKGNRRHKRVCTPD